MDAPGDEASGAGAGPLLATPCRLPAPAWHAEALRRAEADGDAERARYHRAWLRHLAAPGVPGAAPLVSVVVPVRDGNAWIRDAVGSALAQSWPRIEVLVVDDGSQDPPDRVLPRDDPRLRVIRQEPRGVASARNRGIREARGELVHFLDADDWLDADCVARKMEALERVPDADLCVSSYRVVGGHARKSARTHRPPPLGDALCPTRDLLETVVRRYPFHTSTVLAARWRLRATGPMDEQLEHGEDARYWFRLAVAGAKVIALRAALGTRRFVPGGLTSQAGSQQLSWARVALLNLRDVLAEPALWVHLATSLYRLDTGGRGPLVAGPRDPLLRELAEAVLAQVAALPERAGAAGLSARPPLALVEAYGARRVAAAGARAAPFASHLADAARAASARSPAPGPGDVALWLGHRCRRRRCRSAPAFGVLQAWVETHLARGEAPLPPEALAALARRGDPAVAERWATAHRLRPLLGARAALEVARAWGGAQRAGRQGWKRTRAAVRLRTRLRAARTRLAPPARPAPSAPEREPGGGSRTEAAGAAVPPRPSAPERAGPGA